MEGRFFLGGIKVWQVFKDLLTISLPPTLLWEKQQSWLSWLENG